jgi:two-component system, chemotaxis family, response regulator Rcp1
MESGAKAVILLVDDDEGDVLLLREALREFKTPHRLHVAWDGEEAIEFLKRQGGRFADAPRPDLIVLDLNLPRKNGREVFAELKAAPELAGIPVVVLTTSTSDADVIAGHDPKRNLYLTKPMRLDGYLETAREIETFWRAASRVSA